MHKSNFETLQHYLESQIIGQHDLVKQLLIALLADGHILVEGPPGLAKTRAVKSLSDCVEGDFHRIQFTPDLLPADLTGTDIFRPETGEFTFQSGRFSIHSFLLMKSTVRQPKCKPQCLKRWQKSKSPQVATPTRCLSYSWSWRRKTR